MPTADPNRRLETIEDLAGLPVIRVPAALLEKFLDVVRHTGVDFTVEGDAPDSKIVRLTSATDHGRITAALDRFNNGHVREE